MVYSAIFFVASRLVNMIQSIESKPYSITKLCCFDCVVLLFSQRIREVGKSVGISPSIIQGEELQEQGFGGEFQAPWSCRVLLFE